MMMRPWQIWLAFGTTVVIALAAALWLTITTLRIETERESERLQTEQARREAELQERINSALYRMDWILTPLIAQEAARPYYLYQPFYHPPRSALAESGEASVASPPTPREPSPLLLQPSEFVRLHFQVDQRDRVSSPQRPLGGDCDLAVQCSGVSETFFCSNDSLLDNARSFADFERLDQLCPRLESDSDIHQPLSTSHTVYVDPFFENRQAELAGENELQQVSGGADLALGSRVFQRGNVEFQQRVKAAQKLAESQWVANNLEFRNSPPDQSSLVREGVMRPIWIDGQLVLARRVAGLSSELIQCCWLNWERIQEALREEVADLLPSVAFEPVGSDRDLQFGRVLAALPVKLVVPTREMLAMLGTDSSISRQGSLSGTERSLVFAWIGLGFATLALGLLLHGVLQLSERRATFVSAVSHELRTPLTTFRMYAEMMAAEMVPPAKQAEYVATLQAQADRLTRLVDNILQFARLEKSRAQRRVSVPVCQLLDGVSEPLHRRCREAEKELAIEYRLDESTPDSMVTDPTQIEQIIFNLVDNACKYARPAENRRIEVTVHGSAGAVRIEVRDFGPGVPAAIRKRLFRPFCKSDQEAANSAEGVGLGLALCHRMARELGGRLRWIPTPIGAAFDLELPCSPDL